MKSHKRNMWSLISVSVVLLSLAYFSAALTAPDPVRSKFSELRCYTCDFESCKGFDWTKTEPKNCSIDDLSLDNLGPSFLRNLTHVPYSPLHESLPEFVCQKVVVYTIQGEPDGGRIELRRCALRLNDNQTCDRFYDNRERFAKDLYQNATCELCDKDGCNTGAFNYIWIPLLFASIISCLLIK